MGIAGRCGGRGEELGFPTGQETLTALGNGEGGEGGYWEEERKWKFFK